MFCYILFTPPPRESPSPRLWGAGRGTIRKLPWNCCARHALRVWYWSRDWGSTNVSIVEQLRSPGGISCPVGRRSRRDISWSLSDIRLLDPLLVRGILRILPEYLVTSPRQYGYFNLLTVLFHFYSVMNDSLPSPFGYGSSLSLPPPAASAARPRSAALE